MIKLCDFISDFENKLNEEIIGNTVVHDAMRYALSSGGKRLRPYAAYLGACFACKRELTPIEYAVLDSSKLEELGWKGRYKIGPGIEQMYWMAKE